MAVRSAGEPRDESEDRGEEESVMAKEATATKVKQRDPWRVGTAEMATGEDRAAEERYRSIFLIRLPYHALT